MIRRDCGLTMILEKLEVGNYQAPLFGHLDSHAKTCQSQESNEVLNEEQDLDYFMRLCASLTNQKKINPNGLYAKTLEIYCLLRGGARNAIRSL